MTAPPGSAAPLGFWSTTMFTAVPAWVVHGETGDGGITDEELRTLQAYPWIRIVTIPGRSFFTPNEEPALVADLVVAALQAAKARPAAD